MRNVAIVVFVSVFVASGSAAQTLRWPTNAGAGSCLHLSNNPDVHNFQTDILEPAGADRVRARFLVSNRCRVAVRVMGGLRRDGSEIRQRGPIDVLAVKDAPERGPRGFRTYAPVVGRASMPSFVVPAAGPGDAADGGGAPLGRTEVSVLVVLNGVVTPSEVAVVTAWSWGREYVYTRGGSRGVGVVSRSDETGWCAHYEDRRCGEYQ